MDIVQVSARNGEVFARHIGQAGRWDVVTEVWRFSDFWLLFFQRGAFITLPLADMNPAVQALIVERVQAHGGKVSTRRSA